MRGDIAQVVNERAKSGRTWASKTPRVKQVLIDLDGDQFNESTNSIRRKRQKDRNSRFNAVEHFLVRNVGRPWEQGLRGDMRVDRRPNAAGHGNTGQGGEFGRYQVLDRGR